MRLHTVLLVLIALPACGERRQVPATKESAAVTAGDSLAAQRVNAPDSSFHLTLPARWKGAYRLDTLSTAERGKARPGAMNLVYLPQDTTVIPQTLIVVTAYDSAAWAKAKASGGPPPGDSTASSHGTVYVLSLPQSNPFAPGTPDGVKFDQLALTPAEKAGLIQVP